MFVPLSRLRRILGCLCLGIGTVALGACSIEPTEVGSIGSVSRELLPEVLDSQGSERVPLLIHLRPDQDSGSLRSWLGERGLSVLGSARTAGIHRVSTLVAPAEAADVAARLGARDRKSVV